MNKKLIIAAIAVLSVAASVSVASALESFGRPWRDVAWEPNSFGLRKICDEGRAIYIVESYGTYNRGGNSMSIIENARECQF